MANLGKKALAFQNGMLAVFDQAGEQIPELQVSWPELWARHAASCGYNPEGVEFEVQGSPWRIRIRRREDREWGFELVGVEQDTRDLARCGCSLRGRLLGDGCEHCNPKLAAELAAELEAAQICPTCGETCYPDELKCDECGRDLHGEPELG